MSVQPAASNTPGEAAPPLPARRPPPGLPSATPAIPAETPATIGRPALTRAATLDRRTRSKLLVDSDTADGDAMKLPPKPAPRPVPPAVPVEAEHAATENVRLLKIASAMCIELVCVGRLSSAAADWLVDVQTSSIEVHGNGKPAARASLSLAEPFSKTRQQCAMLAISEALLNCRVHLGSGLEHLIRLASQLCQSSMGPGSAAAQPAAEADDGFGDLARHASSEAQATPVESSFANFGGAPSPLELALQDKAELQRSLFETTRLWRVSRACDQDLVAGSHHRPDPWR